MRFELYNVLLLALILSSLGFSNNKSAVIKDWSEISATHERLVEETDHIKKANEAFEKELTGKTVQLTGYIKQILPHFAKARDYYFTPDVEPNCLPLYDTKEYCGAGNPGYVRLLFNGSGKEDKDMDVLFKPHRNRHFKEKGKQKEAVLDDGNYKVYTYEKSYNLKAKIKLARVTCKSVDCSERFLTVHVDKWSIER
ncbi:MAG: hypothetical protein AB8G22_28395 [Saprospiraceae bacterium]